MKAWSICVVAMVSIICVTAIEFFALSKGIDGVLLAGSVAAIVGVPAVLITKKVVEAKKK